MHVLIVGCGYVGLPLGRELVRLGHRVYGLARTAGAELSAAGIVPVRADVTRIKTLASLPHDFDWMVNCAASGGGTSADYRQLYLEGNRNLLATFAPASSSSSPSSSLKKFVYTSSTSVYSQNDGSVVTEESPAEPYSATAQVLVETERMLLTAAQSGFPAAVLRVAGIYGPGRGYAFKQFLQGDARVEGDGSRYMNMIHRDDVIGAIIAALERGTPGEVYNAADNEPVTQLGFYGWLATGLKRPMPPRVAAEAETWRKRGVTNKQVSNAKLRASLGYEFKYPDFRAGYAPEIARLAAAAS